LAFLSSFFADEPLAFFVRYASFGLSAPRCPRLFSTSCEHHETTACAKRDSLLVGRSVLPRPPWGFADRYRSCRYGGFATLPAFLVAALPSHPGLPPNPGVALPRWTGLLGLRLSLCFLGSLLQRRRNVMRQGSCVKARPRYARCLRSLDTRPAALEQVAKGESQEKNRRGPAAKAAERPRSATFTSL
jgi:hypothetical protein